MKTESIELCAACYVYPRLKDQTICRRCMAKQKTATTPLPPTFDRDREHLRQLRASERDYES